MEFISTRNALLETNFHDALFQGFAPDGGLYIPKTYPTLEDNIIVEAPSYSLMQLGQTIMKCFINEIADDDLQKIIKDTLTFPIPLIHLEKNLYLLELFHGPTFAFKDIGARFMANIVTYFLSKETKSLNILVATAGDTGSAIANAFYKRPNIEVFILYPSGKVSFLQEQQMTTLGGNIHALEVKGTFDDCQELVKSALLDKEVRKTHSLTTANSINICRLLPQTIYHSWGICQLKQQNISQTPILSIPSGNFGNLMSALYAKTLGFPVEHFIAATNINATVPHYLETSQFAPKASQASLSNAMDVGNPSNFERLLTFFSNDLQKMRKEITGVSISDEQTLITIKQTYEQTGYILDPHTAVGLAAAKQTKCQNPIIITATAHPAKFPEVVKLAIGIEAETPERLKEALKKQKQSQTILPRYEDLKKVILK